MVEKKDSGEIIKIRDVTPEVTPESRRISKPSNGKNWKIATAILSIAVLVLVILYFSGGVTGNITGNVVALSEEEFNQLAAGFINTQLVQGGGGTINAITEVSGIYQVDVSVGPEQALLYFTKDGRWIQQGGPLVPLANEGPTLEIPSSPESQTPEPPTIIEASADDDAVKGSADAPITIVEFSDFQCPFCNKFIVETLPLLETEYIDTGKVRLVYRDFPLNSIHPDAQKAAEAAECAGKLGGDVKFWEYHDILFANQGALTIDDLKGYAKEAGLNQLNFDKCLDSGEMEEEVLADLNEGASYGVTGTPAFFINGKLIVGAQPFSAFQQIIEAELANINPSQ